MDKQLQSRTARAPQKPGIYRWLDTNGNVLYVGKAKNLRNRLKSYVQKPDASLGPWKRSFLKQIADFDVTVTKTEIEALMLETNLIKELRPKYNVLMKDDKHYVYLKITVHDPYPRIEYVRSMEEKEAKYFGPFKSGRDVKRALDLLQTVLNYRACKRSIDALNRHIHHAESKQIQLKTCVDSQIGRCNGLCEGKLSQEEYRTRIEAVIRFFRGDRKGVKQKLQTMMEAASLNKKFEQAAKLRDTLRYIESLDEQQIVSGTSGENTDVFGIAILSDRAQVVILQERDGKVVNELSFAVKGQADSPAEMLAQFLQQYYAEVPTIPDTILLRSELEGQGLIREWLSEKRGNSVEIRIPERGKKAKLLTMAEENAQQKVQHLFASWEAETKKVEEALQTLQTALHLEHPPKRIECYDISHLGGTETVGSMVVFVSGKPRNDQYRSFTIRTMKKGEIDDCKAMREVLVRRLRHLSENVKDWLKEIPMALEKGNKQYVTIHPALEATYAERGFRYVRTVPKELKDTIEDDQIVMVLEGKQKPDDSLTTMPDLLVLDGGKGQLGVGVEVLSETSLDIPVISLAKREEKVFLPAKSTPITVSENTRFLLMRLRDEAHRFANRHREKRLKRAIITE